MTGPAGLVLLPVFRGVRSGDVDRPMTTPDHDRLPKHLPRYVDNLWEWRRPEGLPSRRSCAFASPTPELARRSGPPGGVVCRVLVRPPCRLVQLLGYPDARNHPDVAFLADAMVRIAADRPAVGAAMDTPLLSRADVDRVLSDLDDGSVRALHDGITLWRSAVALPAAPDTDLADPAGEVLFEAPAGYLLEPVGAPPVDESVEWTERTDAVRPTRRGPR